MLGPFESVGEHYHVFTRQQQLMQRVVPGVSDDDWAGYAWPSPDEDSERKSFIWHTKRFNHGRNQPNGNVQRESIAILCDLYATATWKIPENFCTHEHVVEKALQLNRHAVPGIAYRAVATKNGEFIDTVGGPEKFAELYFDLMKAGYSRMELNRVFTKQEPTKKSKLEEGRQRLIWGPDLFGNVSDALVFDASLEAEVAVHRDIPSKVGMSFYGGEWDVFIRDLRPRSDAWLECDKSSWDWTVPGWLYQADRVITKRLCVNADATEQSELYWLMFEDRYRKAECTRVQLSDGSVLEQKTPGIVKSGWKKTISMNSRSQSFLRACAELTLADEFVGSRRSIAAMGDDTLEVSRGEEWDAQYLDLLRSWGFVIKKEDVHLGRAEDLMFCGHRTMVDNETGMYVPVFDGSRFGKHAFQMTHLKKTEDLYNQYVYSLCFGYAFSPKFRVLQNLLTGSKWWRHQDYFRDIVRGFGSGSMHSGRTAVPVQSSQPLQ